ncbi:MAG: hypothetical protein A2749_02800 [Parcubacteria group bacterium RIFCSPHIGHO2_01_FULL_45_26]|nr:MAG: hypothetical protein A2749_02800 [Parcubacteria group bacterium RIFCSPHIGHO2_01_FULL_45_26]
MSTLDFTIKPSVNPHKFTVEIDATRLERLAANFGMFNPDFIRSLDRSEQDVRAGRVKKLRSLKDLRK